MGTPTNLNKNISKNQAKSIRKTFKTSFQKKSVEKKREMDFYLIQHGINERLIRIGKEYYLITENNIYQQTEVLLDKIFERAEYKNGLAEHLKYSGAFVVHEKLLQVDAHYGMSGGPLGDRIEVKATYDGEDIGDYRALFSYMGGGSKGDWPSLEGDDWALRIILKTKRSASENRFSILYFRHLKSFNHTAFNRERDTIVPFIGVGKLLSQHKFTLNRIQKHRQVICSIQVPESDSGKPSGTFSICSYPGFLEYKMYFNNAILNLKEVPFISYAVSLSSIITFEYQAGDYTERLMAHEPIEIKCEVENK